MPLFNHWNPSRSRARRGYTIIEMATTIAALIIVLGLMVSLARYVRNAAAVELTKDLLRKLDSLMDQYEAHHHQLPAVFPFVDNKVLDPDEQALQHAAVTNNRDMVAALRAEAGMSSTAFGGLPEAVYNEATLRDAWGTPIVFMPQQHPAVGTALQNRRFFFSAGPDRLFLSLDDNLYSYEEGPGKRVGRPGGPRTED
ncbi:MAG: hypothetical protein JWP03_3336 [Phycisphaerales bacterium]|nr:hypothetical protein [Phycisphaerales bacterium]